MRTLAALLLVVIGILGCAPQLDSFPGLTERVTNYYALEKQQNWREAWAYRVPVYRQSVPLATYISMMAKDADGWTLKEAKVRRIVKQGNLVKLEMEFIEMPPKGWQGASVPLSELSIEDQSVWELIDGKWEAWETGVRVHLSLNAALVSPNSTLERDAPQAARPSP